MAVRARHGTYLYQRPESANWWLRLRSPDKKTSKSLGTPDKAQAEVLAGPMITHHKAMLLAMRPAPVGTVWRQDYAPGLHDGPDGGKIFATATELHYMDATGKTILTAQNGKVGFVVSTPGDDGRPVLAVKSGDDALLELYIAEKNVTGHREKEAREMWHIFKTVAAGKPLAKCDRAVGRAVVAALGNVKSATARRKMVPLVALVNLAIAEGKLTFNPFIGCVADKKDSERRVPFDDADMALIRTNIGKLDKADQLLLVVLATMGVRRGEAFEIDREQVEDGVRYVMIGTKTEQSLRRVPLPEALLPYLPGVIKGSLFAGCPGAATKRLSAFLRDIGIADLGKVPHSFRHRAQDRLRAVGCPQDIREELLGHEHKTVASGYGRGHPVQVLKYYLDKVGL